MNQWDRFSTKSVVRWGALVIILALALAIRLPLQSDMLYEGDTEHFAVWMNLMNNRGVFHYYDPYLRFGAWDRPYPPLATLSFYAISKLYGPPILYKHDLQNPHFIALLKLIPMIAEMAMIAAIGLWLRNRRVLGWLIPLLMAVYPGMIVTSAWWGQWESPFVLFLVLAVIAMNKDRPLIGWAMFAIACLFKQPAALLAPMMLVLTFRRYGLQHTIKGISVFATIFLAVVVPFALSSGWPAALSSYLNAADAYPNMTNNAYNFWYFVATLNKGSQLIFEEKGYVDSIRMFGIVPYKQVGMVMLGTYTLLIMAIIWRQANERREAVWAAALAMGFFILPTQVHERYIFPAAVLSLMAVAQDKRVWPIALGIMGTFSYNVLGVSIPNRWKDLTFGTPILALPTALLNMILLMGLFDITRNMAPSEVPVEAAETHPATHLAEVPPYIAQRHPGS
ncbi:MAG: hypothetical protein IT324_15505 [Anaerolineae bacterium]|nr:hypothetical protein [Anaerolineae bacterium]